jgi:hypothetical protein
MSVVVSGDEGRSLGTLLGGSEGSVTVVDVVVDVEDSVAVCWSGSDLDVEDIAFVVCCSLVEFVVESVATSMTVELSVKFADTFCTIISMRASGPTDVDVCVEHWDISLRSKNSFHKKIQQTLDTKFLSFPTVSSSN